MAESETPDSWEELDEEAGEAPDISNDAATDAAADGEIPDTADSSDDSYEDPEEAARPTSPPFDSQRRLSSDEDSDTTVSESGESDGAMEDGDDSEISSVAKMCLRHLPADNYIKPQWVSLLHDFVDSELFIIDGDSLLLELLSEVNLDWVSGGQYLHFIFLLERFLHTFQQLGGIFHIVFFGDMRVLWAGCPSMSLAREVMILHLQQNTPYTVTTYIPSADSEDWIQYLQKNRPAFVALSDGNQNLPLGLPKDAVVAVFKTLFLHVLRGRVNCVFMSEIEHTATKAYGFYLEYYPHKMLKWLKAYLKYRQEGQHPSMLSVLQQNATEDCKDAEQLRAKLLKVLSLGSSLPGGVRDLVTVVACSQVLEQGLTTADPQVRQDIVRLFLLHVMLLRHLSLKQRAQRLRDLNKAPFSFPVELLSTVREQVQVYMVDILNECSKLGYIGHEMDTKFLSDIMDGRLFLQLSYLFLDAHSRGQQDGFSLPDKLKALRTNTVTKAAFFPVSNELVDAFAGSVNDCLPHLDRTDRQVTAAITENEDFDETYHWHSGKPLADDYDNTKDTFNLEQLPADKWERRMFLKGKQKFSRHMQSYGESLEGPGFRKVPIVVRQKADQKQEEKERKKKERQEMAKTAKQKTVKKSKKDLIIEARMKKEEEAKTSQMLQQWQTLKTSLKTSKAVKSIQELERFLERCDREQVPQVATQVQLAILQHLVDMWKEHCSKGGGKAGESGHPNMKTAVDIVKTVSDIVDKYGQHLDSQQRQELAGVLRLLGLSDMVPYILTEGGEGGLLADGSKTKKKTAEDLRKFSVQMSSNRFQLQHMGHLLKREGREDPDPRVPQFIPDTWQRELLDAVDNNESALIVAPTSSGKTYASYYCMEKVLRDGDDGVVVYVSPTKALVNQVAATVYARFSNKTMPDGMSVYGVFTRDYRHNALNCQILVTVPQCLEILLLAPHRQKWAQKIRYVIFDEVHCMGSEIGAEVWEHLLLLIPCPFLALSATISNPHDLQSWLQSAKDFQKQLDGQASRKNKAQPQSYNVRLVVYGERYSDLEKYIYLPCKDSPNSLVPMHPYSVLTLKQLQDNLDNPDGAFPRDLTLSPRETLQLYDTMTRVWPERDSLKALEADAYRDFATRDQLLITKAQARKYEADLKSELVMWLKEHQEQKVCSVIGVLKSHMVRQQSTCAKEFEKYPIDITGRNFLKYEIAALLDKLKQEDKLPALVFSFDRGVIQDLVDEVDVTLSKMEAETLESMGVTQSSIKKDQSTMRKVEKEKKRVRDKEQKKEQKSSGKNILEAKDVPDSVEQVNQDAANMRRAFLKHSFVSEGLHSSKELEKYQRRLYFLSEDHLLKRGIRRGIAYHHAGMNAKQREAVETMFRNKHLKVVVATTTLALGIHMPCKTVVFAGDSVYLDALEYRQMSGRAGRRGFDPVGNVVFFGLPRPKINRLLAANVPCLTGNYPLTSSLVLRLMLLTTRGDDKTDAFNRALNLLKHPFLSHNKPHFQDQLQHHFLFSVQFLMRQGLLDLEGTPQGMAGLASHLHYHEPSNFVLVWLLQKGIFHKICVPKDGSSNEFSDDVLRRLVLILANLFGREFLPAFFTPQTVKNMQQRKKLSQSKLILEDLPELVSSSIKEYNQQTLKLFHSYLCTVAEALAPRLGQETSLPASQIEFLSAGTDALSADSSQTLVTKLQQSQIHYSVVSAFASLSGLDDDKLQESQNMFESVRQGLYIDRDSAPIFPLKKFDRRGRRQYLNSYALDFFKHQCYQAIIDDNGLRSGDAYRLLKDFNMTIMSIYTALEQLGYEEDNVVRAFKQLNQKYNEAFCNAFSYEK
ncbi:probable ATP-dependent RNA helicase DDX60 [Branchiostoma floridae]|uniref:Probable ATP-dependent RNA helicase DDX60 n=1 Tax=Branchiostoma floridae TaxID=7739 RepID=A0A9J7MR51_BRAFL|nr:probable ATP-dependent RNA helicase DDX60 [Branchiostoma floridae]